MKGSRILYLRVECRALYSLTFLLDSSLARPDPDQMKEMEETILREEMRAATTALAGWRRMLAGSLQSEESVEVKTLDIIQRIRSLDAAWARFDKAHTR